MCRTGGRRCPGEHDPAKVAARNARRRAKYAADKAAKANKTVDKAKAESFSTSSKPVGDFANSSPRQAELGVVVTPSPTPDPEGWYQPYTLSGVIDYTKLNDDSYRDFGFVATSPDKVWSIQKAVPFDKFDELDETKNISYHETIALRFYTGMGYEWINEAAHNKDLIPLYVPYEASDEETTAEDAYDNYDEMEGFEDFSMDATLLQKTVNEIDAAVQRGPKRQRIVYRGVGVAEVDEDPDRWVANKRAIGTEVMFDGYTSTTLKPSIVDQFTYPVDRCAIYEILTPEGVHIDPISDEMGEHEVLLPRKQRYVVVGHQKAVNGVNVIQMVAINSHGEILDGTNADPIEPLIDDEVLEKTKLPQSHALGTWNTFTKLSLYRYMETESESNADQHTHDFQVDLANFAKERTLKSLREDEHEDEAEWLEDQFSKNPDVTASELFRRLKL